MGSLNADARSCMYVGIEFCFEFLFQMKICHSEGGAGRNISIPFRSLFNIYFEHKMSIRLFQHILILIMLKNTTARLQQLSQCIC